MEMPTVFSPKFGGISMKAVAYSDVGRERAFLYMGIARKLLGDLPQEHLKGVRYGSDQAVLAYLESGADEVEFYKDPLLMCIGALLGAAASDHWYTYEKQYDDKPDFDEECENADVEE